MVRKQDDADQHICALSPLPMRALDAGCTTDDAAWECLSLPPGQQLILRGFNCGSMREAPVAALL